MRRTIVDVLPLSETQLRLFSSPCYVLHRNAAQQCKLDFSEAELRTLYRPSQTHQLPVGAPVIFCVQSFTYLAFRQRSLLRFFYRVRAALARRRLRYEKSALSGVVATHKQCLRELFASSRADASSLTLSRMNASRSRVTPLRYERLETRVPAGERAVALLNCEFERLEPPPFGSSLDDVRGALARPTKLAKDPIGVELSDVALNGCCIYAPSDSALGVLVGENAVEIRLLCVADLEMHGSMLIKHALHVADSERRRAVHVVIDGADANSIAFFRDQGFEISGEYFSTDGGRTQKFVCYSYWLEPVLLERGHEALARHKNVSISSLPTAQRNDLLCRTPLIDATPHTTDSQCIALCGLDPRMQYAGTDSHEFPAAHSSVEFMKASHL